MEGQSELDERQEQLIWRLLLIGESFFHRNIFKRHYQYNKLLKGNYIYCCILILYVPQSHELVATDIEMIKI